MCSLVRSLSRALPIDTEREATAKSAVCAFCCSHRNACNVYQKIYKNSIFFAKFNKEQIEQIFIKTFCWLVISVSAVILPLHTSVPFANKYAEMHVSVCTGSVRGGAEVSALPSDWDTNCIDSSRARFGSLSLPLCRSRWSFALSRALFETQCNAHSVLNVHLNDDYLKLYRH